MALSVSRIVNVGINLAPQAVQGRDFGILNIAGDSDVINGLERIRSYKTIEGVGVDFGTTTPEYKAAALYFSQVPKPSNLMISRYLRTATSGLLIGGILSAAEQAISNFTSITNGAFKVAYDGGSLTSISSLNFTAATNLNNVAATIQAALPVGDLCTFNGSQFVFTSSTTGASSAVSFLTSPSAGTDISTLLKGISTLASPLVPGYAAETPVQCAQALAIKSTKWFGLMFSASVQPTDDQNIAVSDFIEPLSITRVFGVTIQNSNALDSGVTNDLASRMKTKKYLQSFCQYSSTNAYAIASFFGRAFSVNFASTNSTITLMFKQEPGVVGEELTEQQAETLEAKRCNVFVNYDNDTVIIEDGVMSGPAFFDEIHGLDWFQNAIQTAVYNALYTNTTKIPQTDPGVNVLVTAISGVCSQAVNNGLVAPGVWNQPGFGQLAQGDYMKTGFYVYAQPVALQSAGDRAARKAPPITVAVCLGGAIQSADIQVNVQR